MVVAFVLKGLKYHADSRGVIQKVSSAFTDISFSTSFCPITGCGCHGQANNVEKQHY
jgi:hypothetical protein